MKDGLILSGEQGQIIVNLRSYCELLKWLIAAYTGISYPEADSCIKRHSGYFQDLERTVQRVTLESHAWPYYYLAMDFYFGDYRNAVTIKPPPDTQEGMALYMELETRILKEHNLKEPFDYDHWA